MKEIKFRGKNKDIGWVEGQLAYDLNKDTYIIREVEQDTSYGLEEIMLFATIWYRVDKNTIGQYTGLKDKNGTEIYEGDIIDFSYDMFVGNFNTFTAKGVVVFDEGAFYVELFENEKTTKDEAYLLYEINIDTIEVIRKHTRKSRVAGGERIMDDGKWDAIVTIIAILCGTFIIVSPLIFC